MLSANIVNIFILMLAPDLYWPVVEWIMIVGALEHERVNCLVHTMNTLNANSLRFIVSVQKFGFLVSNVSSDILITRVFNTDPDLSSYHTTAEN